MSGIRRPEWRLPALLVMLLALFATACGGTAATPAPAATDTASTAPEAAAPAGPSPLVGQFDTVDGSTIDLADFEGENVLFWFWEPW